MAHLLELSKCPRCGARGVKIADRWEKDGVTFEWPYCGVCGKNWPEPPQPPLKVAHIEDHR